jgi:hypothetical protein
VALEPCGHNFCATCLSHHLGSQLQSGLQLSCPFRCPPPQRIIINYAVRALIDLLGSSSGRSLSAPLAARAGSTVGAAAMAAVAAAGGPGVALGPLPRSGRSRANGHHMPTAFGRAAGSSNSLAGTGANTPSGVQGQQQQQQQQQPPPSRSSINQQQQQQPGSPFSAAAAVGGGHSSSNSLARATSAAPATLLDGAALQGGGAAAAGSTALPGVAEEPAGSGSGARSRFAAAASVAAHPSSGLAGVCVWACVAGCLLPCRTFANADAHLHVSARAVLVFPADASRAGSGESDFYTQSMNVLCPLDDDCLPMEAANLKTRQVCVRARAGGGHVRRTRAAVVCHPDLHPPLSVLSCWHLHATHPPQRACAQVEVALAQLKDTSLPHDDHLVCLEALARLAWSDDSVRQLVANAGGVRTLVGVMSLHADSDVVQCNGCLALMSLVRGEGEVCQSNQWHVAKAGAIEVIAQAMNEFR